MKLILGSSSKARNKVLQNAGFVFTTMSSDIDERKIRYDDPEKLTLAIANAKADALIPKINEDALLITSDTVVICNGNIYEKPESKEQARLFLNNYSNFHASTVTAIVITNIKYRKKVSGVDIATVYFHPFPEKLIEQLINNEKTFRLAGAFEIENENVKQYIKHIEGDIDSIMGLPIKLVTKLINQAQNL